MNQCNETSINKVTMVWPINSGMIHCKGEQSTRLTAGFSLNDMSFRAKSVKGRGTSKLVFQDIFRLNGPDLQTGVRA